MLLWTLVIVASLNVYGGAAVNIRHIGGFSEKGCNDAAKTLMTVSNKNNTQIIAVCVTQ